MARLLSNHRLARVRFFWLHWAFYSLRAFVHARMVGSVLPEMYNPAPGTRHPAQEGLVARMSLLSSRNEHKCRRTRMLLQWFSSTMCSVPFLFSSHVASLSVLLLSLQPSRRCVPQDRKSSTKIKDSRYDAADCSHQPTDTSSGPLPRRNSCHRSRRFLLALVISFSTRLNRTWALDLEHTKRLNCNRSEERRVGKEC